MKTKSQKILAAYERFAQAVAAVPEPKAQELFRVASEVSLFVAEVRAKHRHVTSSQIVSGLEQGLREMPSLIAMVDAQWRWAVVKALHEALSVEYPEFLQLEAVRLETIRSRGKIRTESEFHFVRHQIDVLEAQPVLAVELDELYALAKAYVTRQ